MGEMTEKLVNKKKSNYTDSRSLLGVSGDLVILENFDNSVIL